MSTPLFEIQDLHVGTEDGTEILKGVSLTLGAGEVHLLMGPTGSGKSTLASTVLGSPEYQVTSGAIRFRGDDITYWGPDVRSKAGMFLAFQHPQEFPGVSVLNFLHQALLARRGEEISVLELRESMLGWLDRLGMDPEFADRFLNEGFSNNEKKRNEVLQMALLEPDLAVLDQTDSGLDIDALKVIAHGVHQVRLDRPELGVLAITQDHRLLDHLQPDHVHILIDGAIVESGGIELAERLETHLRGLAMTFDVAAIKADFPILQREIDGKRLIYLDSANTSQKPNHVIDAMSDYYRLHNANVHRGSYRLAVEATDALEQARDKVRTFINAPDRHEVVFTKNATEAINLVAQTWGRCQLSAGDAVVLSEMEHHANIIPWHMLAAEKGIELRWIPIDADGRLDLSTVDTLLEGAKLLCVSAMSNVLGTINPVRDLTDRAHAAGALALIDASQYVPHVPTDVQAMGADFVAFTGHKMLGPMGIGVLWGRALLEAMPPFLGGGEMILQVTKEGFTTNELPWKFEAGTPMVGEAVGLGAAIDYLDAIGMDVVREHEAQLTAYSMRALTERYGDEIVIPWAI